jgi:hypothetical protein
MRLHRALLPFRLPQVYLLVLGYWVPVTQKFPRRYISVNFSKGAGPLRREAPRTLWRYPGGSYRREAASAGTGALASG